MSTKYDITMNQGALYELKINLKGVDENDNIVPYDLTGMALRSQMRKSYDNCNAVAFTVTITDLVNGGVKLTMPANLSEELMYTSYVWDLEVYDPADESIVYRPLYGNVTVTPEVTR